LSTNAASVAPAGERFGSAFGFPPALPAASVPVSQYLIEAQHLAATIRTLPSGDGGRRLKRALLNAVEDLAVEAGQSLPLDYSEIRRRVLAGEL
jgi:hypothetical protein